MRTRQIVALYIRCLSCSGVFFGVFRRVRKIAKSFMSVCPPWNDSSALSRQIFMKFDI